MHRKEGICDKIKLRSGNMRYGGRRRFWGCGGKTLDPPRNEQGFELDNKERSMGSRSCI